MFSVLCCSGNPKLYWCGNVWKLKHLCLCVENCHCAYVIVSECSGWDTMVPAPLVTRCQVHTCCHHPHQCHSFIMNILPSDPTIPVLLYTRYEIDYKVLSGLSVRASAPCLLMFVLWTADRHYVSVNSAGTRLNWRQNFLVHYLVQAFNTILGLSFGRPMWQSVNVALERVEIVQMCW